MDFVKKLKILDLNLPIPEDDTFICVMVHIHLPPYQETKNILYRKSKCSLMKLNMG